MVAIRSITKNLKISKVKQIIHAYIPVILLFILPQSFWSLLVAGSYYIIAAYFYFTDYKQNEIEIFTVNSLITLLVMGFYVNAL